MTTSISPVRDIEMTTLGNGLRVITEPMPHVRSVSVGIWIGSGSRGESGDQNGVSHFIEHMLFKGTERFPKGEIDRLVQVAAGQSNAETCEDSTHYWFTFPADRWELALAIEAISSGLTGRSFSRSRRPSRC